MGTTQPDAVLPSPCLDLINLEIVGPWMNSVRGEQVEKGGGEASKQHLFLQKHPRLR